MFDYLPPAPEGAGQAESAYTTPSGPAFSLSGLLFLDTVDLDPGASGSFNDTDVRLAEVSAGVKLGAVKLIAGYDFARDGEWRDIGLKAGAGRFSFAVGQFKEPTSLTKYMPQGGTVMLEASRYGSVFAIGRRLGLMARFDAGAWALDAAVTDGAIDGESAYGFGRGQRAVSVRASTALIKAKSTVHFGAYLRHLDYGGQGVTLAAGPHPALAPKTIKVKFTEAYGREAESSLLAGAEFGVAAGRWYAAVDAGRMEIETPAGDFPVAAASIEVSVALTGESRKYASSKGAFKPLTPAAPLGAGGFGALELTARADRIDFGDRLGGETDSYAVGLTWTPQDNLRVLANYTRETESRFAPSSQSYGFRLQFSF